MDPSSDEEGQRPGWRYQLVYILVTLYTITTSLSTIDTLVPQCISSFTHWMTSRLTNIASRQLILLGVIICVTVYGPQEMNDGNARARQVSPTAMDHAMQAITQAAQAIWLPIEQAINSWPTRHRPQQPSHLLPRRRRQASSASTKLLRLYVSTVVAMAAATREHQEIGPFDTDSHLVGIDNRCSGCITHVRSDIPGALKECNRTIKGYGGVRHFKVWTGTIYWS